MAKMNFKTILLDKGEKIALYACGGVMLLLIILGASSAVSSEDPDAITKKLADKARQLDSQVNSPSAPDIPATPTWINTDFRPDLIDASKYTVKLPLFDPILQPDNKRVNPLVLKVTEFQVDYVAAKIPAYDIIERRPGEFDIGVLERKVVKNQIAPDIGTWKKQFANDRGLKTIRVAPKRANPKGGNPMFPGGGNPMFPGGGNPMFPGGGNPMFPGGSSPMGGGPMGRGSMGPTGSPDGMMRGSGMMGGLETFDANSQRSQVIYVPLDDDEKFKGKRLALTIDPRRLVIVQAAFPYKQQLEEIRRALRLQTIGEVFSTEGAAPMFSGKKLPNGERGPSVEIERKVIYPSGKSTEWAPLTYIDNYRPIFMRKFADQPDPADLDYVKLHPAHRLVMPLPAAYQTTYPDVNMKAITSAIAKQKELNKPPAQAKAPNQFKGEGDPFQPQSAATQNGLFGSPDGGGEGGGEMMRGFPMGFMPDPRKMAKGPMYNSGEGNTQPQQAQDPMEYCLIRIVDADIRPGLKYQYRMRVMLENPNLGKKDLVSKPSDAAIPVIEGSWSEPSEAINVPAESALYAVDPSGDQAKRLKEGQAMLQIQRWQQQVSVDNRYKEPFGDWLVANIPVTRGVPVGSRQLVNLPLWSSEHNAFVLREYNPERTSPRSKSNETKHGVMMDLLRPDLLVVDVEGGRTRVIGPSHRTVDDESGYEVLLLSDDGKLRVQSSAFDLGDQARVDREKAWNEWVAQVEKDSKNLRSGEAAGTTGRFGEE